ncbi:MAG TPA: NAD-glutamate dehydrogenase [Woeseiaceae bacterium]|nr:NAD-glutamate dehydrogenase [Woeseiaceae bacterium]
MTRTEYRRGSDVRERIVDAIVASRVQSDILKNRQQVKLFLRQYFAHVPYEDLQGRVEKTMARVALDHLEFGARRKRGEPLVRIFNPTPEDHGYESAYSFIEMVNDDMPFLVDSVLAAINRQGLTVHITVHPVIRVVRNSRGKIERIAERDETVGKLESFIRFAIDKELDAQQLKLLKQEIFKVLADVRAAVRDWPKMRKKMQESRELLKFGPPGVDEELRKESQLLLDWMVSDHFTFLGYREYKLSYRKDKIFLQPVEGSGLGLLSHDERGQNKTVELTREMQRLARSRDWLILTKANSRSTVHRHAYLDYVGIKEFDKSGKAIGERRFIGLFTSAAYSESPRSIPLLRHKVRKVIERAHVEATGHRGKALLHILDTFPRDELFQSSIPDLSRTAIGILNLQDRQRVRFFLRRDTFRRFFSCIVFVPRERYTTAVRQRIEQVLKDAFEGTSVDSSVEITDSPLARLHTIVRTPPRERPRISIQEIEAKLAEVVVSWSDKLRAEMLDAFGDDEGHKLFRIYGNIFPPGYQAETEPKDACSDISSIDGMLMKGLTRSVELYRPSDAAPGFLHFIIFSADEPLALSQALPILEGMGLEVHTEHPYELTLQGGKPFWIQVFNLRHESGSDFDVEAASQRFEECFMKVLAGSAENDGLNRLILSAELDWRETALLRCYAKYLQQLGLPFSQDYMEDVLVAHARLVGLLTEQFKAMFDPEIGKPQRTRRLKTVMPSIRREVGKAKNVDEDRILNAFAGAFNATLRTNYFLPGDSDGHRDCISIKLDPTRLPEAPLPRPKYEIFVYSPEVEGVHLRGGDVARGGLRWSDRREDFRTEVLGLMKAQIVKNTVIVPTGAKGGFFCKRMPEGDRETVMKTGIACYRTFIGGLLDITDNVVDSKVVTPGGVIRRDGDDPYLVVAADKGTATFSDIANEISKSYDFWLDDAFASGGSAGYDHKKMGITARGAWEAVRRHFREQGLNTQTDPFTVVGIGDMSGDVFGNGMLLSRKIKLVAAFNHQHIFLDPDPDMAASFKERQRLFKLPRSSWLDYDDTVISKGGGVFSRQAKTIRLSKEARAMLGTGQASMQPDELIRAILRMPVDLLWNGGIGTYVKASTEGHADVGDRSNDNVRVNANELHCKVVGEGGNLGLTQRARIEFSLRGGRVNTDFIDNSAGVDSSDREVNIKILLSDVAKKRGMSRKKRDELLASMTDDVAEYVLRNNYMQTQALSMSEVRSLERIDEIGRVITGLERSGLLDRDLEYLPDEIEIEERKARKQGMTRPELAVVLSYAKIDVYNALTSHKETLADFLKTHPMRYFPEVLRRRYAEFIPTHRLSPQILATLISNDIVNRMGPAFVKRVQLDTGADVVTVARAYTVARQIVRAGALNRTIEELDDVIPASAQMSMLFELSRTQRHATYWIIEHYGDNIDIDGLVDRLKDGMATVYGRTGGIMSAAARERHEKAMNNYIKMGVPEKLADKMAALLLTRAGLDITDLAVAYKRDVMESARVYSLFNDRLGIFALHAGAEDVRVRGRWQALARSNLRDEFFRVRRDMAADILRKRSKKNIEQLVDEWLEQRSTQVERFVTMLDEMKLRGVFDIATLSVAAKELRELVGD